MLTLRYADMLLLTGTAFLMGISIGVAGFSVWVDRQIKSGKLRKTKRYGG